jgi:PHD/YefM family antitoxin component YafN of YafNO toxin-antitoxin module
MQAVTLKDAKRNLPQLVEQVLADAEPRIVVTDQGGQVIVMPLDEFNSRKVRRTRLTCGVPSPKRNGEHRAAGVDRRMNLTFTAAAWDDYLWFQQRDRKLLRR